MNTVSFKNKTIWITGASSGIGEALAVALAGAGARPVISGRDMDGLERVAEKCRSDLSSAPPLIEAFDMSEHSQFGAIVKRVLDRTVGIDLLINNAGVGQRAGALSCKPDVVRKIMEVNFLGPVFLTQEVLPHMLHRGSGRIAVVSSVLGKFHLPGRSAYAASKHALQGYFDTLRSEIYGSGVGVTIVCPGWIATDISRNALTADGSSYAKATTALSRKMSAADCAKHILRAVASGKNEATIGGIEKWGGVLRTLFPRLYDRVICGRMREFIYKK